MTIWAFTHRRIAIYQRRTLALHPANFFLKKYDKKLKTTLALQPAIFFKKYDKKLKTTLALHPANFFFKEI